MYAKAVGEAEAGKAGEQPAKEMASPKLVLSMREGMILKGRALIEWIDFLMPEKTPLKISDYMVRHGATVLVSLCLLME